MFIYHENPLYRIWSKKKIKFETSRRDVLNRPERKKGAREMYWKRS